jgi:tripartite-type tricarboxylate transporter receptor subunit TctC
MKLQTSRYALCASLVALVFLLTALWARSSQAQDAFYEGRTITLVVPLTAGGPTDIECRLYARYLGKHLKGNPRIIIMNRTGAGGRVAMNWFYAAAPRNGMVAICGTPSSEYMNWYVGDPQEAGLKANMDEIIPVMATPVVSVGAIRTDVLPGIKKPQDILKAGKWFAGGFTVESNKDVKFRAIFDLVGAKYEYITGYAGSADLLAAFMRKEIDYVDGSTPFYLGNVKPMVDEGQALPLWYQSPVEIPEIRPGYKADDFVRNLTGKEPSGPLWELFQMGASYRMILFPPGVPRAGTETLRSGFRSLARDPAFLEDYRRIVGVTPEMLTEEQHLEAALAPWKKATKEIKAFRLQYIEKGRQIVERGHGIRR